MKRRGAPPAPILPEVEEAGPARAYWFENFRRVLLVPDGDCLVVSMDVHRVLDSVPDGTMWGPAIGDVRLGYLPLRDAPSCCGARAAKAEAVILSTGNRLELISTRLRYCGVGLGDADRDEVWRLYREVVRSLEGRDPEEEPLRVPEPVETVYEARLSGGRRRPRS